MNRFLKKRLFNPKASAHGGKRTDLDNKYFRSKWESNCARWLNALKERGDVVSWAYEPRDFYFPVKRGTRFYKPDFMVIEPNNSYYIEVKGFLDQKSITALSRMSRYHPDVTVLLVGKEKYAELESEFGDLPNWER